MLCSDPILSTFCPELLPTPDEVTSAMTLLSARPDLQERFQRSVRIAGDSPSSMARFVWSAKLEGSKGKSAADHALEHLEKCLEGRLSVGLDTILDTFDFEFAKVFSSVLPLTWHGVSREGNPILIVRFGAADPRRIDDLWRRGAAQSVNGINGFTLCFIRCVPEYVSRVLFNEESKRQGRTVDRILAVIDLAGVSVAHSRGCLLDFVKQYCKFSGPVFPELISRGILVNSPRFVADFVWPLVRITLWEVTRQKFSLASSKNSEAELLKHIAAETLPSYLGGRCNCEECASVKLRGGAFGIWEAKALGRDQRDQADDESWSEGDRRFPCLLSCCSARTKGVEPLSSQTVDKALGVSAADDRRASHSGQWSGSGSSASASGSITSVRGNSAITSICGSMHSTSSLLSLLLVVILARFAWFFCQRLAYVA